MKRKIAFIHYGYSSFIKRDYVILSKHFDVTKVKYKKISDIFKILIAVVRSDITFSWFAGGHAFVAVLLSKLFRKKSIVVVGGFEVAKVPEIGYGAMLNPKSARRVKYVLENADKVLTVDESLKKDAIKNLGVTGKNIQTVPTGYDVEFFKPVNKKENLVLTVAYIDNNNIKRKGLETFIKAAEYLPEIKFVVVGPHLDNSIERLKSVAGCNVEFTGFVSDEELVRYYQRAKVYCQLSRYEGLPNALCEAMLCGCVPVGTRYCGIPTAIGDTGFYVPYGDPKATAETIKEALKLNKGKEARERIKKMFPIERREKELIEIINNIISGRNK